MATLVIAEKPSSAEKIARALGDKVKEIEENGCKYYFVKRGKKTVFIVPAVGHLFGVKQKGRGSDYPKFEVEWKPTFKISKKSAFAEKYYQNMKKIAERCDDFVIACDYDQEGEVIGVNILRYLCNQEDSKRMKFSTMTKKELENSFENAIPKLDRKLAEAGICRHIMDWYYGINISRALTQAIKKNGKVFSVMSTGRVQGPMLYFLTKREREIQKFEPVPFWQIVLKFLFGKDLIFEAQHADDKFWKEKSADRVLKNTKNKDAIIDKIKRSRVEKVPPAPFNLTALQIEAYKLFGYSPKQTIDIAQKLYTNAWISYPRTSSQQLPPQLELKEIIKNLGKQKAYKKFSDELISKKRFAPNNGKKSDPAHPAIHPTGEIPLKMNSMQKRVYDLIVRRFLATFAEPAIRESMRIAIDCGGEKFKTSGSRTLEKNWIEYYGPHAKFQEIIFPDMKEGDKLKVKSIDKLDKETSHPNRYSQGSILKELESRAIGTKATRGNILETLYNRGFIINKSIQVTEFGMELISALEKYSPEILSEELTREFEEEMEKIQNGKSNGEDVLERARAALVKILKKLKKHEDNVGMLLDSALLKYREWKNTMGTCPNCSNKLKIMFSPRTRKRFVGCSGYPDCKTGFPLPLSGKLEKTERVCDKCNTDIIKVIRKYQRPFNMCLDPNCETKAGWNKKSKKKKTE